MKYAKWNMSLLPLQARKITVEEMESVVDFFKSKGLSQEVVVGVSTFFIIIWDLHVQFDTAGLIIFSLPGI